MIIITWCHFIVTSLDSGDAKQADFRFLWKIMFQVARLSKDQLKDDAVHKVTMCLEKDSNVVQLYLSTEAKEANYMQPSCGSMFR